MRKFSGESIRRYEKVLNVPSPKNVQGNEGGLIDRVITSDSAKSFKNRQETTICVSPIIAILRAWNILFGASQDDLPNISMLCVYPREPHVTLRRHFPPPLLSE